MFLDPNQEIDVTQRNLPHWQQDQALVFVTWRLADSISKSALAKIKADQEAFTRHNPKPWDDATKKTTAEKFTWPLEKYLDDGHGSCVLARPEIRKKVEGALFFFDGDRYALDSFVVMPNHVHVLFEPRDDLSKILHSWKRFTAKEINEALGQKEALWQAESWDRLIRSSKHLSWTRSYIAKNPKGFREGSYTLWMAG